jgi:lipopolysaccharide export system permease protein
MMFYRSPLSHHRKGVCLPIIFAVLIFISFHFINTFGKKIAQENGMSPFMGWMSSFILSLAILLTYRATNDIGLINMDVILSPFQNYFKNYFHLKNK